MCEDIRADDKSFMSVSDQSFAGDRSFIYHSCGEYCKHTPPEK